MIEALFEIKADVRGRVERVRAVMRQRGLGALLVYEPAQHAAARTDQVFYLTDFRCMGPALLVLPVQGESTLVLSPPWDRTRATDAAGVEAVVAVPRSELIARAAETAGRLRAKLALAGGALFAPSEHVALVTALGSEPADGEDVVAPLAAIRTSVELERIQHAAVIADIGFNALCQLARPGMREYELAAEVDAVMQGEGAEENDGLLASGPKVAVLMPPSNRRLEPGDAIVAAVAPRYRGYFARLERTFVLGDVTEVQRKAFAEIVRLHNARLRLTGPGTRVERNGTTTVLQRGMTFVVDNGRIGAAGLMACADTVVIDDSGARRLTQTPIELFRSP